MWFVDKHDAPASGSCFFQVNHSLALRASIEHNSNQTATAVTTMKRTLRQLMLGGWLLLAGVGWLAPSNVSAQNAAPAQDAAPKSGVVTTSSGSNYILEYGMVIVMFGAALFAICRSSRRNM